MTANVLRKELQGYIAAMPERSLYALKPLLTVLAEPDYVIEPASAEEAAMIEADMAEYRKRPGSFVTLDYFLSHEDEFRARPRRKARAAAKQAGTPAEEGA